MYPSSAPDRPVHNLPGPLESRSESRAGGVECGVCGGGPVPDPDISAERAHTSPSEWRGARGWKTGTAHSDFGGCARSSVNQSNDRGSLNS